MCIQYLYVTHYSLHDTHTRLDCFIVFAKLAFLNEYVIYLIQFNYYYLISFLCMYGMHIIGM